MNNLVKKRIRNILYYTIMIVFSFIVFLPFLACVIVSFKSQEEFYGTAALALPKDWFNIDNYIVAWNKGGMAIGIRNTLLIVVISTSISVFFATAMSYVFSRFAFPLKSAILKMYMLAALIPVTALQVGVFKIMIVAKLINTIYGYIILMSEVDIISLYIMDRYFDAIPKSIDDAARLDGCSYMEIFFKIHLKILSPGIITIAVLKAIFVYNEYYYANLYLQDKTKYLTITTSLYSFTGPFGSKYNIISAGVIISIVPMFILFLVAQKYIYNGMVSGLDY